MAKSNFSFEKRQKELARKKKKEEKQQRKQSKKTSRPEVDTAFPGDEISPQEDLDKA